MREDSEFWYRSNSDTINKPPATPPKDLPKTLFGWQYTGIGQDQDDVELIDDYPDWKIQAYQATFVLDDGIAPGPGIVPYNSSIWFSNRTQSLSGPFLEIGKGCVGHTNYFTRLGSCICYRGQPITRDWYTNENLICVNKRRSCRSVAKRTVPPENTRARILRRGVRHHWISWTQADQGSTLASALATF
jgi:hypothetical protein